ncbi:alpha/beta family hydrolase [Sphingomonas flavescens]|uniref:alpha/beta hydrolase family protein n=1 Tax=Sphingomonas flavescens TaxID=3132797 RepID=UPI00280498CC|nr:alpha/beta family hydrolase [Sphingomonas limnosediminicola]
MEALRIPVGDGSVSALLIRPDDAKALFVFAHGAGAGISHRSMQSNAQGLSARGIATLRYQFPYMERGSKRVDAPKAAHAAVRAAVTEAARLAPDLPLFAGGRSFGGRMTSQAQAIEPLPGVRGLIFIGFPLHPAGKPGIERAEHLAHVAVPMLFVSGERDALAEMELLKPVVERLGERATLKVIADADHSLKVPARSGRTSIQSENDALDAVEAWISGLI